MTERVSVERRTLLTSLAGLATAGCAGNDGEPATATDVCGVDPPSVACQNERIAEQLADVDNFDGVHDRRGRDTVTIDVGVDNGGQPHGFGPPAVRVDPGTTIIWQWTGNGGPHDVVAATDHEIDSQRTDRAGFTYDYVYDGPMSKIHIDYHCSNHRAQDMRGVIAVGDGGTL